MTTNTVQIVEIITTGKQGAAGLSDGNKGDVTVSSNGTVVAINSGVIVDADINADAEIAVSKLADGSARQLLQTNSAGTGVEWASNIDVQGTLDVTGAATFDGSVSATTFTGALSGNSTTATTFQTARNINGVSFDGSADITITAAAGTLTGDTLKNTVVTSSLTSVGTLGSLTVTNNVSSGGITGDAVVTSGSSTSDTQVYSAKRSDELYFNKGTLEEITSGETWAANDNAVATTAALDARIIDLVDDVGGFVPIANETSFPNANPDVNNGAGTIVSISALSADLTSNGSGVITIANGTVGNSTVTINGAGTSETYLAGFGILVETTTTLNTYTFHRLVPKATEVTTVASKATEIERLGTTAAVEDLGILGTTAIVSDMDTLADISSNITTVAGISSNVTTVAGISANTTTVAGVASNVTTVAGSIANVNTVATNISSVNDFSAKYRIASSAPSSNNDDGDLYYDTSTNLLYVYNGSSWDVATALNNNGGTITSATTFTAGVTVLGPSGGEGEIYISADQGAGDVDKWRLRADHVDTGFYIQNKKSGSWEDSLKCAGDGATSLQFDSVTKLSTTANGVLIQDVTGDVPLMINSENAGGPHMRFQQDGDTKHFVGCGTGIGGLGDKDDFTIRSYDNIYLATNNTSTAQLTIASDGNATFAGNVSLGETLTITGANPNITFVDSDNNPDYKIYASNQVLTVLDSTNSENALTLSKDSATFAGDVTTGPVFTVQGTEGVSANLYLIADDGDDNGDGWRINSNQDDNDLTISNNISGSYVDKFTLKNDGEATFAGDVSLPDDKKLQFGDATTPDLKIYHDSSSGQSFIEESGPSVLKIKASNFRVSNSGNSADYIQANDGGAVKLFCDGGAAKFETTENGAVATGSLGISTQATGNPVENDTPTLAFFGAADDTTTSARIQAKFIGTQSGSSNPTELNFYTKPASLGPGSHPLLALTLDKDQNATFAGNVGIGSSNATHLLHLEHATSPAINILDTTNNCKLLILSQNNNSHIGTFSNHNLVLGANSGEHLTINTSGNAIFTEHIYVKGGGTANKFETTDDGCKVTGKLLSERSTSGIGIELKNTNTGNVYSELVFKNNISGTEGATAILQSKFGSDSEKSKLEFLIRSSNAMATALTLDHDKSATFAGDVSAENIAVTKSVYDNDFTNDNLPGSTSGLYVANSYYDSSNPTHSNGNWAALTAMAYDGATNNQSASFIAKSVSGGTTPEVYITQRDGNAQRTAIKVNAAGQVDLHYDGGTAKLSTTSDGAKVTGKLKIQNGLTTAPTMLIGANNGGSGMSNNSTKHANICAPQYLSDTQTGGFRLLSAYGNDGANYVYIGGNSDNVSGTDSHPKSATEVRIFTSATATGNGVQALKIDSSQNATFAGAVSVASKTVSQTATAVAALEIDCATGNYFTKAISASSTFTFANVPDSGTAYGFVIEIDVTGSSTAITWPAAVKWPGGTAPTLTDTKTHVFTFATVDGGTSWRASSLVDYTT